MGDLVSLPGGKKDNIDEETYSLVACANCENALFNWRVAETCDKHVLGCAVCGFLFPIQASEPMEIDEGDDWE